MGSDLKLFKGADTLVVRTIKPPECRHERPAMEVKAKIPLKELAVPKRDHLPEKDIKAAFDSFIGPEAYKEIINDAKRGLEDLSDNVGAKFKAFWSSLVTNFYTLAREMHKDIDFNHPNIRPNEYNTDYNFLPRSEALPGYDNKDGRKFIYHHSCGELINSIESALIRDEDAELKKSNTDEVCTNIDAQVGMSSKGSQENFIIPHLRYTASLESPDQPEAFILESCEYGGWSEIYNKILLHKKRDDEKKVYLDIDLDKRA